MLLIRPARFGPEVPGPVVGLLAGPPGTLPTAWIGFAVCFFGPVFSVALSEGLLLTLFPVLSEGLLPIFSDFSTLLTGFGSTLSDDPVVTFLAPGCGVVLRLLSARPLLVAVVLRVGVVPLLVGVVPLVGDKTLPGFPVGVVAFD